MSINLAEKYSAKIAQKHTTESLLAAKAKAPYDFAGVDDSLAACGAGAAVVGDAGMAVGAVHILSLLVVKKRSLLI